MKFVLFLVSFLSLDSFAGSGVTLVQKTVIRSPGPNHVEKVEYDSNVFLSSVEHYISKREDNKGYSFSLLPLTKENKKHLKNIYGNFIFTKFDETPLSASGKSVVFKRNGLHESMGVGFVIDGGEDYYFPVLCFYDIAIKDKDLRNLAANFNLFKCRYLQVKKSNHKSVLWYPHFLVNNSWLNSLGSVEIASEVIKRKKISFF